MLRRRQTKKRFTKYLTRLPVIVGLTEGIKRTLLIVPINRLGPSGFSLQTMCAASKPLTAPMSDISNLALIFGPFSAEYLLTRHVSERMRD